MQYKIDSALRKELLELQRTLGWMDLVIGSINDAVYVTDEQSRIVFTNQYFSDLLEMPRVLLLGKKIDEVFGVSYDKASTEQTMYEASDKDTNAQIFTWKKDGQVRIFKISKKTLATTKQTVHLAHDITYEQQIAHMKNSFINLASHQLRTPMTSIMIHGHLLKDLQSEIDNPQAAVLTDGIIRASERMIQLINDILNITKIQNDFNADYLSEELELHELLNRIYGELRPRLVEKNLELSLHFQPGLPEIKSNRSAIREICTNLIVNAIQYTPEGGKISVRVRLDEAKLRIIIKDTGIGIPPEAQPHIFDQFSRADNAFQAFNEGTGLGLYLVRLLLQRIGGTIEFKSAVGRGTTFTVTLPLTSS